VAVSRVSVASPIATVHELIGGPRKTVCLPLCRIPMSLCIHVWPGHVDFSACNPPRRTFRSFLQDCGNTEQLPGTQSCVGCALLQRTTATGGGGSRSCRRFCGGVGPSPQRFPCGVVSGALCFTVSFSWLGSDSSDAGREAIPLRCWLEVPPRGLRCKRRARFFFGDCGDG